MQYSKRPAAARRRMPNETGRWRPVVESYLSGFASIGPSDVDRAEQWAERMVGEEIEVIIDRMEGGTAVGRTPWDAMDIDNEVYIPEMPVAPGVVMRARVLAVDGLDLLAEPVL